MLIQMIKILLTTLNSRYSHSAFGLRYLYANLKELQPEASILEFTIAQNPRDIAEAILAVQPKIVGFGVYIWNTRPTQEVVSILKRVRPDLKIILGGPEVSYETETQEICKQADLTLQGEADLIFGDLCREFLTHGTWPSEKWLKAPLPPIQELALPYQYYSDSDIKNRVIYVEASRGCPYKCEYCLSSLDLSVRSFDLELFLGEMDKLIQRGARQFKFLDRTFNLSTTISTRILQFFLDRISLGLFLHFEMVPDRLPTELRGLIRQFPRGSLQFEIGIQTWNPEVAQRVSRRQNYEKIRENFAFLAETRNVHTHADLIAGLPGETLESFARGFDAVAELQPDEIQLGILKRLKGTPIIRHDQEWKLVYQEHPPYQVLQNSTLDYEALQQLNRFAHFWDLIANSGNFKGTLQLLIEYSRKGEKPSLFFEFDALTRFLTTRHPQSHGIALVKLFESMWVYLKEQKGFDPDLLREILIKDYSVTARREIPDFQRAAHPTKTTANSATPKRQKRHL